MNASKPSGERGSSTTLDGLPQLDIDGHDSPASLPEVPGYEVDDLIGRGGMGDVYRARDVELDREVAVKVLRDRYAVDSPAASRFVEEARITAQLQHPGIPAVYRVAKLADGRPFLAMKLIKGRTLDELLKAEAPVNHLAVIEAVAQALGYAHAHGVIHRDLKPANVMVGPFGEVQLMDWGLAKVLASGERQPPVSGADPDATTAGTVIRTGRDSDHTQAGSVFGTPAYMPPEQAAGEIHRVGPASDVFGLGAVWCRLLTGHPPFGGADAESVRRNALRGKTEEALARLDACGAEPEAVALCKRCLAVEPEDRPADANAVAAAVADLRVAAEERAKHAELAQARAEVAAAEQAKRRRVVQRAGVAVAATLLLGLAGTGVGFWQANAARAAAEAAGVQEANQRKNAEAKSALAVAVKNFLQFDILQLADPGTQQQEGTALKYDADLRLRDVVLRATERIDGKFPDQPLIEAEIRSTLANTLRGMGRADLAEKQDARSLELRRACLGSDHPDTLRSMNNLAISYTDLGWDKKALELREETVALRQAKLGIDHPHTLDSMNNLAVSYTHLGLHADALKLNRETLARRKAKFGPDHAETLSSMTNLANNYDHLDRHAEALSLREESFALHKAKLGPDHPDTLGSMNNLAVSYTNLGRNADALKLNLETLDLRKAKLGRDHPETLTSLHNLANSLAALGRLSEALAVRLETLALRKAKLGPEHPDTLKSMNNVANSYAALGRHAEALKLNEETLALRKAKLGPDHPDTLESMANLAYSLAALNRKVDAAKLYEETLTLCRARLGAKHAKTLNHMHGLGVCYYELGRHGDALKLREETLALRKAKLGSEHPDTLKSEWAVIESMLALKQSPEVLKRIEPLIARADAVTAAGKRLDPKMLPTFFGIAVQANYDARNAAACRAWADRWEGRNPRSAVDLYNAACLRAMTAAVQAEANGEDSARLSREDADRAMVWLSKAVAEGYTDATHIRKDDDLAALRGREDFQKLVAELEAMRK